MPSEKRVSLSTSFPQRLRMLYNGTRGRFSRYTSTNVLSAQNEFKDPIPRRDLCRFSVKRNSKYAVAGVLLRRGIFVLPEKTRAYAQRRSSRSLRVVVQSCRSARLYLLYIYSFERLRGI